MANIRCIQFETNGILILRGDGGSGRIRGIDVELIESSGRQTTNVNDRRGSPQTLSGAF